MGLFFGQLGQQLGPRSGRLLELGNYWREAAAFLKATIGNNHYGREAVAFSNWATIGKNNYGREAAAFLEAK